MVMIKIYELSLDSMCFWWVFNTIQNFVNPEFLCQQPGRDSLLADERLREKETVKTGQNSCARSPDSLSYGPGLTLLALSGPHSGDCCQVWIYDSLGSHYCQASSNLHGHLNCHVWFRWCLQSISSLVSLWYLTPLNPLSVRLFVRPSVPQNHL